MPTPQEQSAGYDIFMQALAETLVQYARGPTGEEFIARMDEHINPAAGESPDNKYFPRAAARLLVVQLRAKVKAIEEFESTLRA